jgi:hypothetical protein
VLERDVEAYLADRMKAIGGQAYKFTSPARRGVPDRLVIFPGGTMVFAELKKPGEKPSDAQTREHQRLRALGCAVYGCVDSKEAVDRMIEEIAPLL